MICDIIWERQSKGKSAEQKSSSASKEGVIDVVSTVDYFYHSRGGLKDDSKREYSSRMRMGVAFHFIHHGQ